MSLKHEPSMEPLPQRTALAANLSDTMHLLIICRKSTPPHEPSEEDKKWSTTVLLCGVFQAQVHFFFFFVTLEPRVKRYRSL